MKAQFVAKLREHYKSNVSSINMGRKKDFYAGEISKVGDRMLESIQKHDDR